MVIELWNLTPVVRPGVSCFMARTIRAGWNGEGRMMDSHASFYRGPEPSLPNAESEYSRSTRLAVWAHVKDEHQQSSQPTTPALACCRDSARVELQSLLGTH
jgi:hypothetical protein